MPGNYSLVKTVVTGETILAADRNAEHQNHINNMTPSGGDDYSATVSQMQSTADPYPSSSESQATTLAGELERLRYVIKQITGEAQWYIDPDGDITTIVSGAQTFAGAKTFSSAVTITPTSNQVVLGTTRTVTVTAPTPASSSRTWTIPDISGDGTFAALSGTQTFTGAKTFDLGVVVNETGADSDTRMEGDTNANLFFLDASADRIGIGTGSPSAMLHVSGSVLLALASAEVVTVGTNGTSNAIINAPESFYFNLDSDATASSNVFQIASNRAVSTGGTILVTVTDGGGIQVGEPTGGDKGGGTINASGDIYKNNTAYTNPDYAVEHFFAGTISKFKDNPGAAEYPGLLPLDHLRVYMSKHFDLPGVKERFRDADGGQGAFARLDIALEKLEEAHLYILQLHERVELLEGRLRA